MLLRIRIVYLKSFYYFRSALQLAESERKGGISPHISPFARPRDVGSLLTQAGFVMQTIDIDEVVLKYRSMFDLLEELRGMGESNASWNRCLHLQRDTLLAASAIYEHMYGMYPSIFQVSIFKFMIMYLIFHAGSSDDTDEEHQDRNEKPDDSKEKKNCKAINASFQIIYFIGWKPDPSQPQPLPRGSADMSLKDLYKLNDIVIKEGTFIKPNEEK